MKYPKLPKRFKAKWVAALRSGKYRQGIGTLLTIDGRYCCLGVAASISGVPDERLSSFGAISSSLGREYPDIPKALVEGGSTDGGDLTGALIGKNDSDKWSFKRIANWIEKYL